MFHVSVWRQNVPILAALIATLGMPVIADAQQFVRVSQSTAGTAGDGPSSNGVLSANGQFVVFSSDATNLVSGDTNQSRDVFVRDLVANTTTIVSGGVVVGDSGALRFPPGGRDAPGASITPNGTIVAFSSRAALAPEDTNSCTVNNATVSCSDIYVHDAGGQILLTSVASDGSIGNGESTDPSISADGRFVVFTSSATNLVPGDQNGVDDVFLRDRQMGTTTRLSMSWFGPSELHAPSYGARISADGQIIAFISEAPYGLVDPNPYDELGCLNSGPCARAYVFERSSGTIKRLPMPAAAQGFNLPGGSVQSLAMTSDGRYIVLGVGTMSQDPNGPIPSSSVVFYDRVTGKAEVDGHGAQTQVTISEGGRYVGLAGGSRRFTPVPAIRFDRQANAQVMVGAPLLSLPTPGQFSPDGFFVLFDNPDFSTVPGFAQSPGDVFLFNRDTDGDGMADDWETQFHLNPTDPSDASQDPDGDGRTNLQEFLAGTHPTGTFKRYFAEGAANPFFTTTFALLNPGDQPATVELEYLGSNGVFRSQVVVMLPHTRQTVVLTYLTTIQPDSDFSTIIESDQPVVVDRTMTWDASKYGSHSETAITAPGTTWYLAEGATHGGFDLFYLIENPGDTAASVTINYLRPAPNVPVVKSYAVAAKSRRTIWVDQEGPELAETDVSAKVVSDQPILVERAMYYSAPQQAAFTGGTDGAALPAPATRWFLAEGATGVFFDLYVLIANAESTDAQVSVTYLLPSGAPVVKSYSIAANSRRTISVQGEDPALLDTPVSTIVQSTNDVPVLVERAMWWPKGNWYEGHLTAGSTTTGTKWAIADGEVAPGDNGNETYILIANTSATAGTATVTLYFGNTITTPPLTRTVDLQPNSRVNVPVSVMFPETLGADGQRYSFGAVVESNGPEIVVERATYGNMNGIPWARGASAMGTKLQ